MYDLINRNRYVHIDTHSVAAKKSDRKIHLITAKPITSMSTRAISYLKKKKIPYEVVKYKHLEKGAGFAASATGYPLKHTVKTLVVELDRKSYCLALLPGNRELDLKKLASVLRIKRAAMVDITTAERTTGYLVGGISPFGTRQRLKTVMERSILSSEKILINAGQRGIMLKMSPGDIVAALDCKAMSISKVSAGVKKRSV
ncbi:MAG: aminoacyl-tRNA deacylase [Desulfobacterales bacterium]